MAWTLVGSLACLVAWTVLTLVIPLGPSGAAAHLLLGVAAGLWVRWWALRGGPGSPGPGAG